MSKKLLSKAKGIFTCTTRSRSSSRVPSFVSTKMEVDPPSPFDYNNPSSSSQWEERYTLMNISQIILPTRPQTEMLNVIKNKGFAHTPTFDDALLLETEMDSEFELIFRNVGWEDAWEITEQGSKLLTIEFFSTLSIVNNEVKFRMFNKPLVFTGKILVCL
jgi:hypothetical protein